MKRRKPLNISRRGFLGTGAAAAGAVLAGCHQDDKQPAPEESIIDTTIDHVKIHPGIGVARVGNSPGEFFVGPEVVTPPLTEAGESRDVSGALKRQAARFRVYGYNKQGQVVRELTAAEATIEWKVEVQNRKADWYRFLAAQDLPKEEADRLIAPRRNAGVTGEARRGLVIDPGARQISGTNQSGVRFDTGNFLGTGVTLGELRTDADGRLLFLSGDGRADSPFVPKKRLFIPEEPDTFNNADGWYDDICDGPVNATVTLPGREPLAATSAWVVVAPPNYAPDVISWRTMYDMLVDIYVDIGMWEEPTKTSFQHDILPMLERLSRLSWVNKGFFIRFGKGSEREETGEPLFDFTDRGLLEKLSHRPALGEPDSHRALREQIFSQFQKPESSTDRTKWPYIYGDAFGTFDESPRVNLAPSKFRFAHLERWVKGEFVNDWNPEFVAPTRLSDVPVGRQPEMLDQAALHFCLADAFHPGCELTFPMRSARLYEAPFRIRRRTSPERDYGPELTTADFVDADGPLGAQLPGGLTRWMAIPWHGDTVFCRSGYDPLFDPFLPTFWPARVPNQVFTEADYEELLEAKTDEERKAVFRRREHWVRELKGSVEDQMKQMIKDYSAMGVVEARPAPDKQEGLPKVLLVESLPKEQASAERKRRRRRRAEATEAVPRAAFAAAAKSPEEIAIEEAGWKNRTEFEEFSRIRRRNR